MQPVKQSVNIFIAFWRVIRLFLHFSVGAIRVFFFIRFYDEAKTAQVLRAWSSKLMKILGIRLVVEGSLPQKLHNTLIVANHISWLDILVIFTVLKPRFVAKKEISHWPIIGRLTKLGDTVFIERENKRHIMQVNQQLAKELTNGNCIAVFPESTTSDGLAVNKFKPSLFEPVYRSKGWVIPIAIQYLDTQQKITTRPAFIGDMSLLASVWKVLTCYQLTIKVIFNDVLDSHQYTSRSHLANIAQQQIGKHWVMQNEPTN
ncbi:lysophospholipid acyltransferase family protein [Entomomonas asaccharolytica]|uniref:1-acyl-sn-glycerol-3-phosphate acyltransferase n=1 Tax=Entomomonas asaccharolytica TaxID=2785331 RepID=A0A974NHR8_9GAMM|nr:lysophospholipid acyltransferase family protein [Entomomonas asaccharolytica]QQP86694.1 1-acyl-sn-glycerol-3-phosphate acyltransferase [Entomomonas asaccharolytica]